jgi:hypothetical protein
MNTVNKIRDSFLYGGRMILSYTSLTSVIIILFSLINLVYPDILSYRYAGAAEYAREASESSIRYSLAFLIVAFISFYTLDAFIRKCELAGSMIREFWANKLAHYLTIFISTTILLGNTGTLIWFFLNGEISSRFLLKVFALFLVFGLTLWYEWLSLKAVQLFQIQVLKTTFTVFVLVLTLVSLFVVGFPQNRRLTRIDDMKESHLQQITTTIELFHESRGELPKTLAEANLRSSYMDIVITDPETGEPYEYAVISPTKYQLCAVFNLESPHTLDGKETRAYEREQDSFNYHTKGRNCFVREVLPPLNVRN